MQLEDFGGAFQPFDDPACLLQHSENMVPFDLFEGQSISRHRARRWNPACTVSARLARGITHRLRERRDSVQGDSRQQGAIQP